jgi:hypothetical protein
MHTIDKHKNYSLGDTYSAAPDTSDDTILNMQKYITELERRNETLEAKYNTIM